MILSCNLIPSNLLSTLIYVFVGLFGGPDQGDLTYDYVHAHNVNKRMLWKHWGQCSALKKASPCDLDGLIENIASTTRLNM